MDNFIEKVNEVTDLNIHPCPYCGEYPKYKICEDFINTGSHNPIFLLACIKDKLYSKSPSLNVAVANWNELVESLSPKPDKEAMWNIKEDFIGE